MRYRYVLLDFDGTLTATERVTEPFLAEYRERFLDAVGAQHAGLYDRTEAAVRAGSPHLAWMLEGYEACPAAADPFIVASVVTSRVLASLDAAAEHASLAYTLYKSLYEKHPAPFRPEATEVLGALVETGATVAVISNSSTGRVKEHLAAHLGNNAARERIHVFGDARKFGVRPATVDGPVRARFEALPDITFTKGLPRPTWLRRGAFYDALARVWAEDAEGPASTIFCGDIWELDLALPSALGCDVHLVERLPPLATCGAEHAAVESTSGAGFSADLHGLLGRVVA